MRGAALATILGYLLSAALSIAFLCSHKSTARFRPPNLGLVAPIVKAMVNIGLPACLTQISLSFLALSFNHVAQGIGGSTAVASYGIIYSVVMLVYMPIMGLGQGIQPILGYNLGAGNHGRVRQALAKSLLYVTIFCVLAFGVIELFSGPIAVFFGGGANPELVALTKHGLRLFCLTVPIVGVDMIGANYFQYIGKYRESMLLSALRQIILTIPLVWLLPKFFGLDGMWLATPVADAVVFVVTVFFLKKEISSTKLKTAPESA